MVRIKVVPEPAWNRELGRCSVLFPTLSLRRKCQSGMASAPLLPCIWAKKEGLATWTS